MGINWTPEQLQVIESRHRNLLVSAAAGSGKTAVLVERIIRMITDETNPMDIDCLLVMTFTNAAAAEMRERVAAAIDKKLLEEPENAHLQLQAALIPHAQITTIDSFCLSLIRNHFNQLDIDPSFRIGDEGELILMQADVMKELLEDYYEAGSQQFQQFVETYAVGKADGGIEDYIRQVYTFSQSNPWPSLWLEACGLELEDMDMAQLMDTKWLRFLMRDIKMQASELIRQTEQALEVCREENGPAAYGPMLEQDLRLLRELMEAGDYEELNELLKTRTFDRLASIRSKDVDGEKKDYVTSCRDRVKKAVGKLKENYCFETTQEVMEGINGTKEAVRMLLTLAEDYGVRYQESKKERNVVDFNDLEHYALEILLKLEDGVEKPTETADELSRQYEEILVDEYQDSNDVQETLITSVSRERFGTPNVFMVGDVKQSIYKFRLARPELFLQKYESYTKEESSYQKIELHENFRSRDTVLTGINDVFYRIMTENLGNIEYTKEAALHPGATFEPCTGNAAGPVELLMVNTSAATMKQLDEDSMEYTGRELEAKMIARRIRQMVSPEEGYQVWDKKEGSYRPVRYGDMVILLRSVTGWTEVFLNVLMNEGIPAYAESRMGYFNTIEIETVLSVLGVVDNPMQDIPLAATMKMPGIGMGDEELAYMMAVYKKNIKKGQDRGIYGAWRHYLSLEEKAEEPYPKLITKLKRLDELIGQLRQMAAYLPIHEVIYEVYAKTGYYDYASAMPSGDIRRANLDMLVEKAAAYEKTSYKGLFHFIRYIENLKKYDTDFGEASVAGEQKHTVKIMSIHKSKGLEFPVVFLAGMGKNFNKRDLYSRILIDPDLGIGTDYLDLELRLKSSTLKKNVLKRRMELEALGEELRVLYVAMTRAKEKLILTAADRYLERKLEKWSQVPLVDGQVPFTILSTANSCLDWLLMSLAGGGVRMELSEIPVTELVGEEIVRQAGRKISRKELLDFDTNQSYDLEYGDALLKALSYRYPYAADISLHTKMSVSELKRQGQLQVEDESDFLPTIPAFMETGAEVVQGAYRGTAYHRAMELLDFGVLHSREAVEDALESIRENNKMSEESLQLLDSAVLWTFLASPLGCRLSKAQANGKLHKEQQFVIGIPADQMEVCQSKELVLIQGIIDAYMEEEDGIVLVDYKTDKLRPGQEHMLIEHYGKQLKYYQKALEQTTGKKVKQKVIYSLTLQKEIEV